MKHLRTLECIADIGRRGSIRASAEHLNITPSSLTRKIQDFEDELGTQIFERLPQGMRLNAAGELLVRHIQGQMADFERLKSQIADLSGVRRGHVSIATAQPFAESLLPEEISAYRSEFPGVSFEVVVRDHRGGIDALLNFEVDLVLLIDPPPTADLEALIAAQVPLCALMSADHPLAGAGPVRLRDCCAFPIAMPDYSLAMRYLIDLAMARADLQPYVPIHSGSIGFLRNYVLRENAITFRILSGTPRTDERLCLRPIDQRDMSLIQVVLAKLRRRRLPIATAKFADQLCTKLTCDEPLI